MNGRLVSIDLAKNVFQVCVLNEHGKLVSNKRVSRAKLRTTLAQMAPATVVMESCYSANYWGREFEQMGHTVKLVPAQHVKPFVRGSKNDANDALAIAEAAGRPKIRFVPVKSVAQQDIQLLHRAGESAAWAAKRVRCHCPQRLVTAQAGAARHSRGW
jgi:transposase